jgi:polyhydroxybutyrate depolymerase
MTAGPAKTRQQLRRRDAGIRPAVAAAALWGCLASAQSFACSATEPCVLPTGEYLVRLPQGWDGRSPLPTVVFLHGHMGSAAQVMADAGLTDELDARGILLVAPDGVGRSWSFAGKLTGPRDDIAFLESVADDIAARFPVDRERLLASGFSVGGSMVWYLACQGHGRFSAYAPAAGAFWMPEPQDCAAGPQNLRHVHGTEDAVVPLTGRRIGAGFHQGDVMRGIATWRRVNGCNQPPVTTAAGGMICERWNASGCSGRRDLEVCLHDGGHEVPRGWIAAAMEWTADLKRRRSGLAAAP